MAESKHPPVSVQSFPNKPIYDAISLKQDKIKNADDIPNGEIHRFIDQKELVDLSQNLAKVSQDISKLKEVTSSDHLEPGSTNLFFSDGLAMRACITRDFKSLEKALSAKDTLDLIRQKQDPISSSDDIKEGSKNLYFDPHRVIDTIEPMLSILKDYFDSQLEKHLQKASEIEQRNADILFARISEMQRRILSLECVKPVSYSQDIEGLQKDIQVLKSVPVASPVKESSIPGASSILTLVTDVKNGTVHKQDIEIRSGKISRIFPEKT